MGGIAINCFLLEMFEDLPNYRWVFNAANDFDVTTAVLTDFDVDIEDAFESLHPAHSAMPFIGTFVEPAFIG